MDERVARARAIVEDRRWEESEAVLAALRGMVWEEALARGRRPGVRRRGGGVGWWGRVYHRGFGFRRGVCRVRVGSRGRYVPSVYGRRSGR